MIVLGIESSCDETGAALINDKHELLAQAIHTQIDMHRAYGGVVPELASRDHIRRAIALMDQVLSDAHLTKKDIDAIAVTEGPGLAGALLVGSSVAHAAGYALGVPVIGETLDDAAGEAFDKTAQLLGECYPGGPAVSRLAENGTPGAIELPRPMLHSPDLNLSFAGLKTAVLTTVQKAPDPKDETFRSNLARGFVDAVVEVLTAKAAKAMKKTGIKDLVVAGGVSANKQLREGLIKTAAKLKSRVYFPPLALCTDNGAMIVVAGMMRLEAMTPEERAKALHRWAFSAKPRWKLSEASRPDKA